MISEGSKVTDSSGRIFKVVKTSVPHQNHNLWLRVRNSLNESTVNVGDTVNIPLIVRGDNKMKNIQLIRIG